jgi:hypothetical protein
VREYLELNEVLRHSLTPFLDSVSRNLQLFPKLANGFRFGWSAYVFVSSVSTIIVPIPKLLPYSKVPSVSIVSLTI